MTQNAIQYFGVNEQIRSNREQEAETRRKNLASEAHNAASLAETVRHNQALEAQQAQQIAELARHNREQEALGLRNVSLGYANIDQAYANLAELARSHRAQEAELFRSNKAREFENFMHNRVTEFGNLISASASRTSSKAAAKQAATAAGRLSHDKAVSKHTVAQQWVDTVTSGARNIGSTIRDITQAQVNTATAVEKGLGIAKSIFKFGF